MTLSAWIRPTASPERMADDPPAPGRRLLPARQQRPGRCIPAGGGTLGSGIRLRRRPDREPGERVDARGPDLRRRRLRLFVNGSQVATRATTGAIQTTTNPLWIGGNQPYGEYFQGLIDEVRVYNRALTAAEIQTDMNTSIVPAAPDTTPPSTPSGLTATRGRAPARSTWAGPPRRTTSASPAIASSAARAPAARTSRRSAPRPARRSTTPGCARPPPTATGCAPPTWPATSAPTRRSSRRRRPPRRTPRRRRRRRG